MYYFQIDSKIYRGYRKDGKDKKLCEVQKTAEEAKVYAKRMLWREVKRLLKGSDHEGRI